jgi:hypothetical protein
VVKLFTTTKVGQMKSSDEQVAEKIIAEFKRLALFDDGVLESLYPRLCDGSITESDWAALLGSDTPDEGEGT